MTKPEILADLNTHFGSKPGFDAKQADQIATHTAAAIHAGGAPKGPTPGQQQCYANCQKTKDTALAACALKGWPLGIPCALAAVTAFNACRHQCDQNA
jgi:hypothetical protein